MFVTFPSVISTLYSSYCKHPAVTSLSSILTHEFDAGSFPLSDKSICVFNSSTVYVLSGIS